MKGGARAEARLLLPYFSQPLLPKANVTSLFAQHLHISSVSAQTQHPLAIADDEPDLRTRTPEF